MNNESQESAFALLKEAKEKGTLDPSIKAGLAELVGEKERRTIEEVLNPLSPKESAELLARLKNRFSSKPEFHKRPKGIEFPDVKDALEGRPDLMWSLAQMENSGGAVDIRSIEDNEYVFCDFTQETPLKRRDMTYHQAVEKAKEMGVDIQSEAGWRALQKLDEFDLETWLWLKSDDIIDTGFARRADRFGVLRVDRHDAESHHMLRGWRAELRVKKNLTSVDSQCPARTLIINLLKKLGLD